MAERVNYCIDNGVYVGWAVNMPIVVQEESFDEMVSAVRILAGAWGNSILEKAKSQDGFEFVQTDPPSKQQTSK